MSKKEIVLVFDNNRLPKLLVNPKPTVLSFMNKSQMVRNPNLKHLKSVPMHEWILENGGVRKANKEEKKEIENRMDYEDSRSILIKGSRKDRGVIRVDVKEGMDLLNKEIRGVLESNSLKLDKLYSRVGTCSLIIMAAILANCVKDLL